MEYIGAVRGLGMYRRAGIYRVNGNKHGNCTLLLMFFMYRLSRYSQRSLITQAV